MRASVAKTILLAVALLALAAVQAGCGGEGGSGLTPREQGKENTLKGSYQVKGMDGDKVQGVGIYSNGSFRIVLEGVPRVVIHNEQSGENWLLNLALKNYQSITYDQAVLKAGFMPHLYMKGYFDLEQHWAGSEFYLETADGRTVRAFLGGPGYLPSSWSAESDGEVLKGVSWEYRRVGRVSQANFEVPEGFSPSG